MSSTQPSSRVRSVIDATRRVVPGYFERCLAQRIHSPDEAGSTYGHVTPAELEVLLRTAMWVPYEHADIAPGCHGFRANIAGWIGIVALDKLEPERSVSLADPKGTGYCEAIVAGVRGATSGLTVAILGVEAGEEVLFTFHPGAPIKPSRVTVSACGGERQTTVADARLLGFTHAKTVSAQ